MTFHTREGKPERKRSDKYQSLHRGSSHLELRYDLLGHDTNDLTNCDRKKRYKSKQSAKEAVKLAKRNGWKRYAYACTICRGFHLTKQDPATARRIRRGWTGSRATEPPVQVLVPQAPHEPPQEIVPTPVESESGNAPADVLCMMTEKNESTDRHTEIARAAGYASAEDLGEPAQTLDAICRECHLAPMVLGAAKFYPVEDVRRELAARAVPEGMVAAIDWARKRGVDRNRVPNAIRDGKYPGKSHYGKPPGMTGKARYYILPEEAAEWCGLNKKVEAVVQERPSTPWVTLDEASRLTGLLKSSLRELADDGDIQYSVLKGEYFVLWSDVEALAVPSAQPSMADAPAPSVSTSAEPFDPEVRQMMSVINQDVLRMVREANERQREMHSKLLELVEQQKALESRIDAKLAAGAAVWKKTVAERDAAHAQSIADAVAQALDEFERGRRRVA